MSFKLNLMVFQNKFEHYLTFFSLFTFQKCFMKVFQTDRLQRMRLNNNGQEMKRKEIKINQRFIQSKYIQYLFDDITFLFR